MNNLADLRRRMQPGITVQVVNHLYPELSGERTVLRAQTKRWCLEVPTGHPRHGHGGSWMDIPKAGRCSFDGDSVTISREEGWGDAWSLRGDDATPFTCLGVYDHDTAKTRITSPEEFYATCGQWLDIYRADLPTYLEESL